MALVSPASPDTQVMGDEFQFLLCHGCQKQPTNPKLLPCLHTLCTDCLQENESIGQCPNCQAPIPYSSGIPAQDNLLFTSLQSKLNTYQKIVSGHDLVCDNCGKEGAFWCFDCEEFLCIKCFETHQRYLKRESHKAQAVRDLQVESATEFLRGSKKSSNFSCPKETHTNQMLSIYCRECQKPICCICALLDNRHTSRHCDIKVEIQQRQQELGSMTEELKKKEELFEEAYSNLKSTAAHLDQVRKETQEHIQKTVEQLVELIREKGRELLERAERDYQLDDEELVGKIQQTKAMLKRMETSKQLVEKMHHYALDREVMDMHPFIKGSLEELRKMQPLSVGASVQARGVAESKASLQVLLERVTGKTGTSTPPQDPPSEEESTATVTLSPEALHAAEASHQHREGPTDREGLFSWEGPRCLPCAQAEPGPAEDGGGDVWSPNQGAGSPALPVSPPAQLRRNGEEETTSGQLTSSEVEILTGQGKEGDPLASMQRHLAAWPRMSVSYTDSLLEVGCSILKGQRNTNRHLLSMLRRVTFISRSLQTLTSALLPFLQEATSFWQAVQQPAAAPPGLGSPPLAETLNLSVPSMPSDLLDLFLPSTPEGSVSLLPPELIVCCSSGHSPPRGPSSCTESPAQPQPLASSKGTGEGAMAGTSTSMDHIRGKHHSPRSQGPSAAVSKKKRHQC